MEAASATRPTAAGGRSGIGRLIPRLPILGDLRLGRRLGWVIPVLIALVAGIVVYNARALDQQRGSALVVNLAARQRALVERYTTDVLLKVNGFQADPEASAEDVREPVDVLLDGGSVRAPQGDGSRVEIPPARDWRVRRKLEQDRRLIDKLIKTGDGLLDGGRDAPSYEANVTELRVLSAQLSSVSNDAAREITQVTEASISRLVRIEIALGVLGVLAALALGLLLRRAGAEQAAQFRSLVNNSSDLITVLAPDGTIAYQSPSVQRMLGRRPADLDGTALGDLVHPDDRDDVSVSVTKLVEAAPGATANFGCRLQHKDGSWRHVESICTNLADDPRVNGLVLNIRDVTEQAALRQSISDLLHNLARRSQGLVDRQLELIDELERNEVDPDRLQELFRMDHLATRMRRNVENLIVLSGVDQRRRWSESVPLRDVVEAAVAEVEEYSRVQVVGIDDLTLAGHAASDVAHLVAELVENATSFSSPTTRVEVSGGFTGNGYVIEIEDHGIGMSDAELDEVNRRLAEPLAADVAVSRMMGFHVVGRLAARHGIRVQLRHCWFGGVTALVLLPAVLLDSAGEHPAMAPPVPAGVTVSPESLLLAHATKSGWQPRSHPSLRRHAAPAPNRGGDTGAAAGAGEPID
ncbi:MAG TPA: PAS domain S-box protein [Propionibacteriaceae bacterium]|nr:PAS domain S-box protein [Propionibacteriaceae bacterium]